ncbi:hypothetical protein CF319_g8161 [Tilletia indica]|nr:hypothetical protein CF319_g8161 [Tilletia indica]
MADWSKQHTYRTLDPAYGGYHLCMRRLRNRSSVLALDGRRPNSGEPRRAIPTTSTHQWLGRSVDFGSYCDLT